MNEKKEYPFRDRHPESRIYNINFNLAQFMLWEYEEFKAFHHDDDDRFSQR